MSLDDLASAIATFEEIEKYHPNDLRSVVRLGFLKFEAREWEEAAVRFELDACPLIEAEPLAPLVPLTRTVMALTGR